MEQTTPTTNAPAFIFEGKGYDLKFNTQNLILAEQKDSKPIPAIIALAQQGSVSALATLLWAGLQREDGTRAIGIDTVRPETVVRMIEGLGMIPMINIVGPALKASPLLADLGKLEPDSTSAAA